MVHNGDKVKDKVTGYEGLVIGITYWLNGCVRVGIQGVGKVDEFPKDPYWADEGQIEVLELRVLEPGGRVLPLESPGGPTLDPKRSKDPRS